MPLHVIVVLWAFGILAVSLVVIDVRTHKLPYPLTLPLLGMGMFLSFHAPFPWWQGWLVALACIVAFWAVRILGQYVMLERGDGDAMVLGAFGAVLGLWVLPVIVATSAFGALLALIVILRRRSGTAIPYSPAIVAPGLVAIGILVL